MKQEEKNSASPKDDPHCVDPVCQSKVDLLMSAFGKGQLGVKRAQTRSIDCPVDREELGSNTWSLLHTIAAYYPEEPDEKCRSQIGNFVSSLASFYPCQHCAEDFRESIKKNPIRANSRKDFSIWMCEQHNQVNRKIGKKEFSCNIKDLDMRWKTGHASCWKEKDNDTAASESLGQQ